MPDNNKDLTPLARVKRIAVVMKYVIIAGMAFEALGAVAVWGIASLRETVLFPSLGLSANQVTLSPVALGLGFVLFLVPLTVLFFILVETLSLFRHYARGEVFSTPAIRPLHRIAVRLVVLSFLSPITRTFLVLDLTFGNQPGHRLLSIGFSSDDYLLAAFGGLLLAIAWVMVEASKISEENNRFV